MRAQSPVKLPCKFGEYTLREFIAYGGTSELFRAELKGVSGFSKTLIIKRIQPPYEDDRNFVRMLVDEAKLCARLQHVNIVQIYELGQQAGRYFIAMEYVNGVDLNQVLDRTEELGIKIPLPLACFIMEKSLTGLDFAHKAKDNLDRPLQIVHRDFNPTNLLLTHGGEIKITDFGIAKAAQRSAKTMTGVIKGKFGYFSPEQVACRPLDRRSDLFTAGTVLWEMLAGRRMFVGSSFIDMIKNIREARTPDLGPVTPPVPTQLAAIVHKARQQNAADRFPSAAAFAQSLRDFRHQSAEPASAPRLEEFLRSLFDIDHTQDSSPDPREEIEAMTHSESYWDPVSLDMDDDSEETVECDMIAPGVAREKLEPLMRSARFFSEENEHGEALDLLSRILDQHPENEEAIHLHGLAKQNLIAEVLSQIGDMDRIPEICLAPDQLIAKDFDHLVGFMLSLVDGQLCYDDILSICGQPQLSGMRILSDLLGEKVIRPKPAGHQS